MEIIQGATMATPLLKVLEKECESNSGECFFCKYQSRCPKSDFLDGDTSIVTQEDKLKEEYNESKKTKSRTTLAKHP